MVPLMIRDPEYELWLKGVHEDIKADTLWRMSAYRFSLYAMSRAQADVKYFARCRETRGLIDQLLRAVGGISANLEEGTVGRAAASGRTSEYALGTARESRGWYYKCALALPPEILSARMALFTQIVRILTVVVPAERESITRWRAKRKPPVAQSPLDAQPPPDHLE
jgi:four helix bundle protein